jgi:Ca2+-binding RTX toxin-like protein
MVLQGRTLNHLGQEASLRPGGVMVAQARTTGRVVGVLTGALVLSGLGQIAVAAVFNGTLGDDTITGTPAADTVWALGGDDVVHGAGANDVLHGGPGADLLFGDAGGDVLRGDSGADTMLGNGGADTLYTVGSDVAHGGAQSDELRVGPGDARAFGDAGADRLIASSVGSSVLVGGPGVDELVVEANGFGKVLRGAADGDSLLALADGATLEGGAGADVLVSRFTGTLVGGDGDDVLAGDREASPTQTVLACGAGVDRVTADLADVIGSDCEDVTVNIAGDDGDNIVVGTMYADSIFSGDGNDGVQSLGGNDGITLGGGQDSVDAGDGDDTVFAEWGSHFQIVGDVDDVTCGSGNDTAFVDDVDTVSPDCETVFVFVAPKGLTLRDAR